MTAATQIPSMIQNPLPIPNSLPVTATAAMHVLQTGQSADLACCKIPFVVSCWLQVSYGDGSFLYGSLVQDDVTFGAMTTRAIFGQIEAESAGFERTDVDGILGLAYYKLDPRDGDSVFGECRFHAGPIGQFDQKTLLLQDYVRTSFQCAWVHTEECWFWVESMKHTMPRHQYTLQSLRRHIMLFKWRICLWMALRSVCNWRPLLWFVAGVPPIVYNENKTIVDSGTTLLALPPDAFQALAASLKNSCPKELKEICDPADGLFSPSGSCYSITLGQVMQFPNISIVFQGWHTSDSSHLVRYRTSYNSTRPILHRHLHRTRKRLLLWD